MSSPCAERTQRGRGDLDFESAFPHGFCVGEKGQLNEREVMGIQAFIKKHYMEMYLKWSEISDAGFYEGR